MVELIEIENVLQTYTFEEILEMNDLTEADALLLLVEQDLIILPDPEPL